MPFLVIMLPQTEHDGESVVLFTAIKAIAAAGSGSVGFNWVAPKFLSAKIARSECTSLWNGDARTYRIVGVVGEAKYLDLHEPML